MIVAAAVLPGGFPAGGSRREAGRPAVRRIMHDPRRTKVGEVSESVNVIDVRSLVPMQRHARIFQLVNGLEPEEAFVLVNDHDPKPLYYQLEAEYPGQFSWTYLESGPEVWRVRIGKLAARA